jgi:RNA-directed DNA polymerase
MMDTEMLKKWLEAGYIEKGEWHPTERGTAQGALCSPAILNITLSGLEETAKKAAPRRMDKVHTCTFADDFIITGATKEVLEEKVKPAVEQFLKERGLSLSQEKTKITHIGWL